MRTGPPAPFHPFPSSREVMLPAPIPTVKPTAWMIAMREKTMLTAPEALVAPFPRADVGDKIGVRHVVDGGHQHADDGGHRQPADQSRDGGLQHLFPLFFRTFPLHFFLLSAFPGFSPCLPLSAARQR